MNTESGHISTKKFTFLLILAVFLESAGYIAFPFLTIRLRDHFGLSAQGTGTLLLVAFWLRPIASLIVGQFSSKVSASTLSLLSCLFEAVAFFGLAFAVNVYIGALSLIIGNIGLALWRPGLFASVYNDRTHPKRSQRISLLNGALNGGSVLGCLLGALLVKLDVTLAFLFSGGMYALLAVPIFFLMKPSKEIIAPKNLADEVSVKIQSYDLFFISLATICSWATLGQFTIYIGLLANDYLLDSSYTGLAFSISGLTIVAVSFILARQNKLESKLLKISFIGLVFAFIGWGSIGFTPSIWVGLTIFVVFISIFEAITVLVIADRWSIFGAVKGQSYNYAVRCFGQGLGGFIGGYLYVGKGVPGQLIPWIVANWILLIIFLIALISFDKLTKTHRRLT